MRKDGWSICKRDKEDGDREKSESDSPTAVRVGTFLTDTVGSARAGTRRAVWYGHVGRANQPKNDTVGNNEPVLLASLLANSGGELTASLLLSV